MLVGCWLHMRQPWLYDASTYAAVVVPAAGSLLALAWVRAQLPAAGTRLRVLRGLLCACAMCELSFGLAGWRALPRLQDRLAPQLWGASRRVVGVVQGLPAATPAGWRFVLAPLPEPSGLPSRLPSRLLVSWSGAGLPRLQAGQAWSLPLRLRPPYGQANPGGFDTELWLFGQGIGGTASVRHARDAGAVLRCPRLDRAGPWQRVQALRERLRRRIDEALPGHARAGTLAALALGDQAAVGAEEWQVYRTTGVAHLMAISGLHIAMQAWLAGLLFGAAWRRLHWRGTPLALRLATPLPTAAARWVAAWVYGMLAGLGVPAQRALLMLGVALALRVCARRLHWTQVLGAALCAVLLWDPWAVAQPGLWLSFGAVAALLLAQQPALREAAGASRVTAACKWLREAARAQWAVCIALVPLTLAFFQQVSLVSPLANALAIPVVTLGVVPPAVGGLLLPPPLDALAWRFAAMLQDGLLMVLRALARWPGAQWQAAAPSEAALALALPGVLALVLPWPWRMRLPGLALLAPMLLQPAQRPPAGHFDAWIADVGQGGAAVLRTRAHTLVFDTGPKLGRTQDAGERVLLPLLRELRVRRLDRVVLSHADSDHVGGAASLARAYPGTPAQGSVAARRMLDMGFASPSRCLGLQGWSWDGVRFEWLHPDPASPLREDNTAACVLRVQGQAGSMLLTSDIGWRQEQAMLRDPRVAPRLRSDLMLAAHHGSGGSNSAEFVDAVAPRVVGVQAGMLNLYGHPHAQALRRLGRGGVRVARTDRDGALHWRDDAPQQLSGWRSLQPRYWRAWPDAADAVRAPRGGHGVAHGAGSPDPGSQRARRRVPAWSGRVHRRNLE